MRSSVFGLLASAALLVEGGPAGSPGAPGRTWVRRTWNGADYDCKCFPGDSCWPTAQQWQTLNTTVGGNLQISIPPAASCYNTFEGPLGSIPTYDAAECADVTANFGVEQFQ